MQFDFGFNGADQPLIILRGFPSVSMTTQGAMSGGSTYYLDGSKVAGVPINLANVQSVEVIKGPASVLYGRAEPGGLVNVVSKPIPATPEASVQQTLGQYDLSRTVLEAAGPVKADGMLRACRRFVRHLQFDPRLREGQGRRTDGRPGLGARPAHQHHRDG